MITTPSPLVLNDFLLLNCQYEFIHPDSQSAPIDLKQLFSSYVVDIDFGVKDENGLHNVFVKIEVNNTDQKKEGYSLFAEGVGIFTFSENLSQEEKNNLINYSAISICIANLRAILANVTAYCPMGKYNLPSIDLNALLKAKTEQQS